MDEVRGCPLNTLRPTIASSIYLPADSIEMRSKSDGLKKAAALTPPPISLVGDSGRD
jgi:hypothetical protein